MTIYHLPNTTNLDFTPVRYIGSQGKNSEVFIAHDPQLNSDLAIKKISKPSIGSSPDMFFRESQIMFNSKHENIMEIQYATYSDTHIFLAMPYLSRGSLQSLIEDRFLSLDEIMNYCFDFLSGLHYIHSKNLVHCDIKPTNLLINNVNKIVITDFGVASYLSTNGLASPDMIYPLHFTPEALAQYIASQTWEVNVQFDIYQAGLTMYRMCWNEEKFKNSFEQYLGDGHLLLSDMMSETFPERKFDPCIPNKLQSVIKKATKPNLNDRYPSIIDMLNELSRVEIKKNWKKNSKENWNAVSNDMLYNIDIIPNANHYDVISYKENLTNGTRATLTNFTGSSLTHAEAMAKVSLFIKNINDK